MSLRLAAVAACVAALSAAVAAQAADPLSLADAYARVEASHPDLRVTGARRDVLAAELDQALLHPPLVAGAAVEDLPISGAPRNARRAELSLTLASVLERGDKPAARQALASSRIDALAVEHAATRLDLMAETARRYLAVAAAQEQGAIAASDIDQRQRTVARTRQRLAAGASPESVVLTAEAALARAELDQARARQQFLAARQHLAALWGERDPDDAIAAADLQALPAIASFDTLTRWLQRTPELARFASAQRVREARLQLARSEASADLDWQVGLRRLADTGDVALIGSVSVPLGAARRAEPRIRAAQAELALLEIERESGELSLYSTLAEAHGRYLAAQGEVRRLDQDIIPRLSKAEAAAERSYRAGAAGYLEWAQLQSERTAAHRQQLDAALAGQRALIELQRLTGQSLLATRTDNQQDMQP